MKAASKPDTVAVGMIVAMFVLAAVGWTGAPERIPVHWTWSGQPDRFGGRIEGLLGLPLAAVVVYGFLCFMSRIDPHRKNYDDFVRPLAMIRAVTIGAFFGLQVSTFLWVRGVAPGAALFAAEFGIVMVLVGNYLPKIKPNWFVGVRTPWTLSSEACWHRTHRLAGWLFVTGGALIVVSALVRPDIAPSVMLTTLIATGGISVVYSFIVWRRDRKRPSSAVSI